MWNRFLSCKDRLKKQYETHCFGEGESPEVMREALSSLMKTGRSPAMQKAERMAYVMRHARLEVLPEEFFADKLQHGDLLIGDYGEANREIRFCCGEASEADMLSREAGITFCNMDFGHIGPDWPFLMREGIPGVIRRLEEYKRQCEDAGEDTDYYDSGLLVYRAFADLLLRFAEAAEKLHTEKSDFTAGNLRALAGAPPETLAQAMQLTLLYYRVGTDLEGTTVRSLGGLDRLYAPFYAADLASGHFSKENLRELTADFLWKISAMKVTANLPICICGRDASGREAAADEYAGVLLEEYEKLGIYDPKFHVLYREDMNREILDRILRLIRGGKNSFVFINADTAERALENIGISPEDARRLTVYGCYETAAEGTEVPCTCGVNVNLVKALELALYNGTDPMTGKVCGPATGSAFTCFADFYLAVKRQLSFLLNRCMDTVSSFERKYPGFIGAPLLSATYEDSVKRGIDLYAGGAKYNNTSVVCAGLATLTDGILAVKRLLFTEKRLTLAELQTCLADDWHGYEALRRDCRKNGEKYGNGLEQPDGIAADIVSFIAKSVNKRENGRGGIFRLGVFSVDWRFFMGEKTGATPDGRKKGEPISKNAAASLGQDRRGVTALIGSVLKLNAFSMPDGCVTDVVLHESAVRGDEGLIALRSLLKTFMKGNGFAIHFNVLDPETLKRAQEEPEKYRNLQIRLCGWNVYFTDLCREEQDEFILQASER